MLLLLLFVSAILLHWTATRCAWTKHCLLLLLLRFQANGNALGIRTPGREEEAIGAVHAVHCLAAAAVCLYSLPFGTIGADDPLQTLC